MASHKPTKTQPSAHNSLRFQHCRVKVLEKNSFVMTTTKRTTYPVPGTRLSQCHGQPRRQCNIVTDRRRPSRHLCFQSTRMQMRSQHAVPQRRQTANSEGKERTMFAPQTRERTLSRWTEGAHLELQRRIYNAETLTARYVLDVRHTGTITRLPAVEEFL